MVVSKRIFNFILFFSLCAIIAKAQDRPIGYWRSHLPYNSALGVATDGSTIYTLCIQGFFSFNALKSGESPVPYSKVEGMSDLGMQSVAYDMATSTTVLAYVDGNIDLFKEKENTFYNIPDFKIKSLSGNKTIYGVYTENGTAYISTSIGILVIDLTTHNINETYQFIIANQIIPVSGFVGCDTFFYALTARGIYRASKNNSTLQNFQVWQLVDSISTINNIAGVNNTLFLSDTKSVYSIIHDTIQPVYTCTDTNKLIQHIDAGNSKLLISETSPTTYTGAVIVMDVNFNITDSYMHRIGAPLQAIQLLDSSIWIADGYNGLEKLHESNVELHIPDGPSYAGCFDIYVNNKNCWVAHGGFNDGLWQETSMGGVSNFNNDKWTLYKAWVYPPFDTVDCFVSVVKDETNGTVYMGSYLNGLFILNQDGTYQLLNKNSIFDTSISYFGDNQRQVVGLALDQSDNLWVTLVRSQHQLYVRSAADSTWAKFLIPVPGNISGGQLAIDDNGQVWFAALGGGGVAVYQPANNVTDFSNKWYHFTTGAGSGNLPSNNVFCIAKDKTNSIWVGTDNGIGIISNCTPSGADSGACDAQIPIVQYDQFAGYLFAGSNVRTIAVDGANRKWVGTDIGVWLLSPNADKIIYRFTVDNSPLPSNNIKKIAIDKVTGDVYFGTDNGLVSYRSTATDGGTTNQSVEIFPNPVQSGYTGTIAIKGLAANADVRITDISGQLVYKTQAFGGQAVWNGKDYTGHRPQTGVYLVFVSSSDGAQTYKGKIVFMQ